MKILIPTLLLTIGGALACGPAYLGTPIDSAKQRAQPSLKGGAPSGPEVNTEDWRREFLLVSLSVVCQGVGREQQSWVGGPWSGPMMSDQPSNTGRSYDAVFRGGKIYRALIRGGQASFRDVIRYPQGSRCYLVWPRSFEGTEISQASYRHSILTSSNRLEDVSGPRGAELNRVSQYWMVPFSDLDSKNGGSSLELGATQWIDLRLISTDQKSWNLRVYFRVKREN
jgi:hypothetical protein